MVGSHTFKVPCRDSCNFQFIEWWSEAYKFDESWNIDIKFAKIYPNLKAFCSAWVKSTLIVYKYQFLQLVKILYFCLVRLKSWLHPWVPKLLVWGETPEDPERNDFLRLEGMDNDFGDPERNDILRLEGMRWESGSLILINNGFTLFVFVIFRYLM